GQHPHPHDIPTRRSSDRLGYRPSWDLEDSPSWKAIERWGRQGGLTQQQTRLLETSRPALEFYDLRNDPNEFDNAIDRPEYNAEVDRKSTRLNSSHVKISY